MMLESKEKKQAQQYTCRRIGYGLRSTHIANKEKTNKTYRINIKTDID